MLTFAATWWIWLSIAIIWIIGFTIIEYKKRQSVSAQFIEPISFIGCSIILFNLIGIISSGLSIISSILKLFMWYF